MQSAGGRGQDFSALQQHIDELTTAKFELQRGMAQQGKLAASLAAENMRLSEDFNHQVSCAYDSNASRSRCLGQARTKPTSRNAQAQLPNLCSRQFVASTMADRSCS